MSIVSQSPDDKHCPKCKEWFPRTPEFWHKDKKQNDGYATWCKGCKREYDHQYNQLNRQKKQQQAREWYKNNPEKARAISHRNHSKRREKIHQYYLDHADEIKARIKKYEKENRARVNQTKRNYRQKNIHAIREKEKQYRQNNKGLYKKIRAKYRETHKKELKEKGREYQRHHRNKDREKLWAKNNPIKIMAQVHRRRAQKLANGGSYTQEELKAQFESQGKRCFHCGKFISLNNGKTCHIDHWQPLSRGGSNNIDNIRLLCPFCNLSKGAKLPCEWDNRYCDL